MIGGFSNKTGEPELAENHEINVTSFIDVILVLLIIFMVAASILIDLSTASSQPPAAEKQPVYLTVEADLTLTVNDDQQITLDTLDQRLAELIPEQDTLIFLRADKRLTYEELMNVINALGSAGRA